eukprot:gene17374-19113_t
MAMYGLIFTAIILASLPNIECKKSKDCKRVRIHYCISLGYRETYKENFVGQSNQRTTIRDKALKDFMTLQQTGCSNLVRALACSIYVPKCFKTKNIVHALPPCRSLCNAVKLPCKPYLNQFSARLSTVELNCNLFPEPGPNAACVDWTLKDFKPVMRVRGTITKEQLKNRKIPPYRSG